MELAPLVGRIRNKGSRAWEIHSRAIERQSRGDDVIVLSVGDSDTGTPAPIVDAAKRSLDRGRTHYTRVSGEPGARAAIAAATARRTGVDTAPDDVVVTAGAQNALFSTAMCLLAPGDEVIVPTPMYATYEAVFGASGATLIPVACAADRGFRADPSAIAAAVTERTRAVFITTPHNPTGVVLNRAELMAIADICLTHDLWLMSDEVYWSLVYDGAHVSPRSLPGMADRTVAISSLSKSHSMTGWRLGWAVVPPMLATAMADFLLCTTYGLPPFIQDAVPVALSKDDTSAPELCARFRARRDLVCDQLAGVEGLIAHEPEGGMFVMADIRGTGVGSDVFANRLLDRFGVSLLAGEGFGGGAEGFVRISLSAPEDRLVEACRRIAAYVAEGPG